MVYLVLKFGGATTLSTLSAQRKNNISLSLIKDWIRQLGAIIGYLHALHPPIIHRDLKPDNILVDDANRVMLVDFGVACQATNGQAVQLSERAVSYGFSSPEQLYGMEIDERSDIYS
jgi:serine/threonine-protein kinase